MKGVLGLLSAPGVAVAGGAISIAVGVAAWLGLFHEVMSGETSLVLGLSFILGGLGAFGIKVALDLPPPAPKP